MLELFRIHRNYSFRMPARTRLLDVFRYLLKTPLENFIASHLIDQPTSWYQKLIPPVYLYQRDSIRHVRRDELNYQLDISRLLDHSIFFYGTPMEPGWINLFKYIHRDSIVFDIGANIGFLSLNFARICENGFVFSFEPSRGNFQSLQANIRLNGFKNIAAYKIALGGESGQATLYNIYPNNPGANRILAEAPGPSHESECIDVTTADAMADQLAIKKLDVLKIDVEGFEMFVLQGAQHSIKKWRPILFVELSDRNTREQGYSSKTLIEYIESLDYLIKEAKTLLPIDKSEQDHHVDILCLPKERVTQGLESR